MSHQHNTDSSIQNLRTCSTIKTIIITDRWSSFSFTCPGVRVCAQNLRETLLLLLMLQQTQAPQHSDPRGGVRVSGPLCLSSVRLEWTLLAVCAGLNGAEVPAAVCSC